MVRKQPLNRQRSGTPRSRTGCQTCRSRRIKCDETPPSCLNCTRTGRQCDGPAQPRFRIVEFKQRAGCSTLINSHPCLTFFVQNEDERHAFDYFKKRVVPSQAGALDSGFWSRIVLQCCHEDQAIYYASLAMSAFCEHHLGAPYPNEPKIKENPPLAEHHQAMAWYGKSLQQRCQNETLGGHCDILKTVVSSFLFSTIEMLQQNNQDAFKLIQAGFRVWAENHPNDSPDADAVSILMNRQAFILSFFGRLPQEWRDSDLLAPEADEQPHSLESLSFHLHQLMYRSYDFIQLAVHEMTCGIVDSFHQKELEARQYEHLRTLDIWQENLEKFLAQSPKLGSVRRSALAKLRLYHTVMQIWLSCCLSPLETIYDKFTPQFAEIVRFGESAIEWSSTPMSFSHELGVTAPLHLAAWKCRHPELRRRLLVLLSRAPKQECVWAGHRSIENVKTIMEYEESMPFEQSEYWPDPLPAEKARFLSFYISQETEIEDDESALKFFIHGMRLEVDDSGRVSKKDHPRLPLAIHM